MVSGNFDNLYAIVVWFHPTEKEYQTLSLYKQDVAHVVVVDNSETDNSALLPADKHITYIPLLQNAGIATALNKGCQFALEHSAEWVLTMDQDSRWDQHTVRQYLAEVQQYEDFDKVAIFSPFHDCDGHPQTHHKGGRFEDRELVMCSGNLLRLKAWQQANGFRDDFFIDIVDDEICCHLRQLGWQVIRANQIQLTHHLGNGVKYLGPTKHPYTPHPAWRYFYIARNIRRMFPLYPEMKPYYKHQVYKYLKRIFLYDFDHKGEKLKAFYKGWTADRSLCGKEHKVS
ncbi:MAG: glycosyltransferase [Paludibacteraceae bacterium]|nr:glycosyltransferase [Paludibacteraceae bacterium]